MPSWKKVVASGSDASFSSATIDTFVSASSFKGSFTGSLFGTASQAVSSSYAFTASSAISASFAVNYLGSGSISTRLTNEEATSSLLVAASGSFSTRVTNTEATSSNLVAASASFSTRITNDSASFSTRITSDSSSLSARVTNTETTASNLVAASGSFSTRVTQIERTYATTGSNIFTGSQNILGAITASAALINGTLTAQTLVVTTVSSSVVFSSGSNVFGNSTANTQTFTGSVNISGSLTLNGRGTINDLTGSLFGTASWATNFITGSVTSASYAFTASSAISSSFASTASSVNTLVQPVLISGSFTIVTGSGIEFQVTNTGTKLGNLITDSHNITGSLAVLGSITGSLSGSVTGSLFGTSSQATSASYAFTASSATSASVAQTASFVNPLRQTLTLTGSLNVSGSTTQVGTNNLFGNTSLSGSLTISGSQGVSPTINIFGDVNQTGYTRYLPVTTNIDTSISASYIFVSGSTQDLYFSQNSKGYNNVTRLRWLEGNLYTGLLNGGVITSQSSTVYQVSSGSGIIVDLNASLNDNPYPTIQYLNWGNLSQSIAPLTASYQQAFVSIDSTGNIYQQGTPYAAGQYDTEINIGVVLFQNQSTINGVKTQPSVAYGFEQQQNVFNRAFGPLKLSGYTLAPSGSSTGSLVVASGTAYSPGSNYSVDPNNPSYTTDSGTNVSKIFRYRQSGSTWVYDTNAGAGYTAIDPTQYSNNGVLTAVPGGGSNRQFSIQRVFYFPNSVAKAIVVYYGNATYATEVEAIANIAFESFVEAPNTAANAIYLGAIVVRNNANFTNPDSYKIQPGGLFRQVGGSGGGGSVVTQTLAGLSDVNISGPTNGQPLVYNSTSAKWENQSTLTANLIGNAQTATSASQATSASYAFTASSAISASFAVNYLGSGSISTRLTNLETASGSFSTRTTNTEITSSNLVAASGSFSTRVTQIERTYATTGSNIFTGSQNILGAITASAALINGTLTAQTLVVTTISSSVVFSSGSNIFGNSTANTQTFTGSVNISGSLSLVGRGTINDLTGSLFGTASWATNFITGSVTSASYAYTASSATNAFQAVSASFAFTASSAVRASASLIATSASYAFTASSAISSSYALTASFLLGYVSPFPFTGSAQITGSLGVTGSTSITGSTTMFGRLNINDSTKALLINGGSGFTATTYTVDITTGSAFGAALAVNGEVNIANGSYVDPFGGVAYDLKMGGAGNAIATRGRVSFDNGRVQTNGSGNLTVSGSTQITGSLGVTGSINSTGNITTTGTLTAQTLIVSTISSSVVYSSGSNIFGNSTANTQTMTGSLNVSGSATIIGRVTATNLTGSLFGTASQALTASYALGGDASAILYQTASAAFTWSFNHFLQTQYPVFTIYDNTNSVIVPQRIQAVDTASALIYFSSPTTGIAVASKGGYSSSVVTSAVIANTAITASFALSGTGTFSGSFSGSYQGVLSGSLIGTASQAVSASYVLNAVSSSYAFTASSAISSSYALTASFLLGGASGIGFPFTGSAQITGSLGVTGSITSTGNITTTGTLTAQTLVVQTITSSIIYSSGSNIFGSQLTDRQTMTGSVNITGSLTLRGNAIITGSLNATGTITGSAILISGSGTQRLVVVGSGSAQPIFTVQGSQGELFSVTDSLSGSLFSVNDLSGLPILEVFSDNTTLVGNYLAPALNTTNKITTTNSGSFVIYAVPTASYDGVFVDYTAKSGSSARAGVFAAIWSGSSVNYMDNSTTDFGNTSLLTLAASISGGNMVVTGSVTTGSGWTVKAIIRSI